MKTLTSFLRASCLRASLPIIGLGAGATCHAQDTFVAHYLANGPQGGGDVTACPSGGFYGVSGHGMLDRIHCYKLDAQADLVWLKEITFSSIPSAPLAITALSDEAFAFVAVQFGGPSVVCKVTDAGELLWTTTLYEPNGGSFQGLAPTTDGGMMLTGDGCAGSDMILHLDGEGHIVSQHGHASWNSAYSQPNARKIIHEGNNQYAYLGHAYQPGGTYRPMTFARSDSAGNVYNYREIHFPLGIGSSVPDGETIVRSTTGGHYMTTAVESETMDHVVLCYLNAQDELVWSKAIATPHLRMTADALAPTADGGCVLMGSTVVVLEPYLYHTYAVKFNAQGAMVWSKMFGDIDVPLWDRLGIQTVVPAGPDAFLAVPVRWSQFDFCLLNANFSGYCYEQAFAPTVTDAGATAIPYPITSTTINFVEGSLTPTSVPNTFPRVDLCASFNAVEEASTQQPLTVAPNPATTNFRLYVPVVQQQMAEVRLLNVLGAARDLGRYHVEPGQPLTLAASDLPNGTYVVEVRTKEVRLHTRLTVER